MPSSPANPIFTSILKPRTSGDPPRSPARRSPNFANRIQRHLPI